MPQSPAEQQPRKRPVLPRKIFQATAVIKFNIELSPDLEDAVQAATHFLEEELGFESPRVLCVEIPGARRNLRR